MSSNPILLDRYTKFVLTLIALFAGIIALRPLLRPAPIHAQSAGVQKRSPLCGAKSCDSSTPGR